MSDDGKSFMDRRQDAELLAAQITNVQSVSFIERQEIHRHHHGATRAHALEELASDIGKGLEQTLNIR